MNQTYTPRNSAIELLRIVAMLMIVLSHICVHSGFDYTYSMLTVNRLFVQFGILGNLGTAIFILISGYFLAGKPFRTETLSRLLAQVWFYSIVLFLVCKFGFGYVYSEEQLWQVFLPTVYGEYWFFTAYVILLLLSPFLNLLIQAMTRSQFRALLGCLVGLWVLIPTLTEQQMYAAELPQFVLFYFIGAYFRKYPDNVLKSKTYQLLLTAVSFLVLFSLTVILGYCERYTPEAFGASFRFYDRNSLMIAGAALGLFAFFLYVKPFTSRLLNTISGCTFGVYLIHDNPAVREILWKQLLNQSAYFTSGSFIPRLLGCVLLVFTLCTIIEYLRRKTLEAPMTACINKILSRILGRFTGSIV